jgi:hypothetical protein
MLEDLAIHAAARAMIALHADHASGAIVERRTTAWVRTTRKYRRMLVNDGRYQALCVG